MLYYKVYIQLKVNQITTIHSLIYNIFSRDELDRYEVKLKNKENDLQEMEEKVFTF